ncbi:hypothetical protein L1987_41406 [Smallanthus sonchifolius]|uniref:Uncharacterized protein n=1 Tax=Smallanthus sonchifolius TaxID=185202 RepID=A0ACB9GWR7_9ASTR|nr:hypothetical protein L1987_41406 [Smallanthus sonchifolius]
MFISAHSYLDFFISVDLGFFGSSIAKQVVNGGPQITGEDDVFSVPASVKFYNDVLGFVLITRPSSFDFEDKIMTLKEAGVTVVESPAKIGSAMFELVFSSTATVYGQPKKIPCVENFELKVTNPYVRTKLLLEEIARGIPTADPEWKIILLRYFNSAGAHESGKFGEDAINISNNLSCLVYNK